MKNITLPWYVKLILAYTGGLLALAAIAVDLVNAYLYGLTTSHTMAALAIIVALAVVFLPMYLELGAPSILWVLWFACVVATMYCAYQYYAVSAKQNNVEAHVKHMAYASAEADKTLARETLTRIKEHGDINELAKLARNADASADKASVAVLKYCTTRRVTEACTTAQTAETAANVVATLAHNKLSDSKSWHEAKLTLANATATQTNGDAVEKDVDVYALLGALVLVQCLAALSGIATKLGAEALAERATQRKAKAKAKAGVKRGGPTDGGTPQGLPSNVINMTAARWVEQRTIQGNGRLQGGEAKKNFERFTGQKISAKQFREALIALLGVDAIQAKNSGYVILGRSLRVEVEQKQAVG